MDRLCAVARREGSLGWGELRLMAESPPTGSQVLAMLHLRTEPPCFKQTLGTNLLNRTHEKATTFKGTPFLQAPFLVSMN